MVIEFGGNKERRHRSCRTYIGPEYLEGIYKSRKNEKS